MATLAPRFSLCWRSGHCSSHVRDRAAAQRFGLAPDLHGSLTKYVGQGVDAVRDTLRVLHQGVGVGSADRDQFLVDALAAHPHEARQLLDAVAVDLDAVGVPHGTFAMAGAFWVGVAFAAVARRGVDVVRLALAMIRVLPDWFRVPGCG
jgi:hypothetical protein